MLIVELGLVLLVCVVFPFFVWFCFVVWIFDGC